MSQPKYTFGSTGNDYFNGRTMTVSDGSTQIRIAPRDGFWCVEVKDHSTVDSFPDDVLHAFNVVGESRVQGIYDEVAKMFWDWADDAAAGQDLQGVIQLGRSGGWLGVIASQHFNSPSPAEVDDEETEDVQRFLDFAFAAVAEIDTFRAQFHAALIEDANQPPKVRIMVLADGETYSGLEGCKVIEVGEDSDFDDMESMLKEYDATEVVDHLTLPVFTLEQS